MKKKITNQVYCMKTFNLQFICNNRKKNSVTSFVGNWHIYENAVNYVVVCFTVRVKILIYMSRENQMID